MEGTARVERLGFPINLLQSHLVSYNVPANLNGNWNVGFVLGVCLVIQLISGLILASTYVADVPTAFYSIVYVLEEVNNGFIFRYLHSNGVCLFFVFIYAHVAKGALYSCSYLPMSWYTGIVTLLLTYAIGFLGYVLPFGQMSYWGATVIINLFYWYPTLVSALLGGYSVGTSTLGRFYLLHFILPFALLLLVVVHIYYLHLNSSSNPLSTTDSVQTLRFSPAVLSSDVAMLGSLLAVYMVQLTYAPVKILTGDSDNSTIADPLSTPLHIVPEWYLLPFYGTLKLLPSKLAGLIAMILFLQVLASFVDQRAGAFALAVQNVHRIYSTKKVLMFPLLVTLGYMGMYHLNGLTSAVGTLALLTYVCAGVRTTSSSLPCHTTPKAETRGR